MAVWFMACVFCVLAAACGEDDEDRIDAFVEAVSGEISRERVDHVLATYLDLQEKPLSTTVLGDMRLYRAEDAPRLEELARTRLARMYGSSLKVLRRHIEIKGEVARVDLQLIGDGTMGNVSYELYKRDKRWLIAEVRIAR